jgi:hypothetical protein
VPGPTGPQGVTGPTGPDGTAVVALTTVIDLTSVASSINTTNKVAGKLAVDENWKLWVAEGSLNNDVWQSLSGESPITPI